MTLLDAALDAARRATDEGAGAGGLLSLQATTAYSSSARRASTGMR